MARTSTGLAIPQLRVQLLDGDEWDVQALNPDMIRYERTAAKHKWPKVSDAPFLWMTFLAWSAGQRNKLVAPAVTFDQFAETVALISEVPTDDDDLGDDEARPTPPALAAG